MRLFELLLEICSVSYVLWFLCNDGATASLFQWLPFAGIALLVLHFFLEGYRWQMAPAYAAALSLVATYFWCRQHDFRLRLTIAMSAAIIVLLLLGVSAVCAGIVYPVFRFAPLSGPFAVGTVTQEFQDTARRDPHPRALGRDREIVAQFWYPAAPAKLPFARYGDARVEDWRTSYLSLVRTRARGNAPALDGQPPFAVVVFTPTIDRTQDTFLAEDLASRGFVVIGIDHPYGSDAVVFSGGRIVRRGTDNDFLEFTSDAAFASSTRRVEDELAVRVADVGFLLTNLARLDPDAPAGRLAGRLNLDRVGIVGHSFGGAVAAEACRRNPKIAAAVNMDGWLFGESIRNGVPKPYLVMSDDAPAPSGAPKRPETDAERRIAIEDKKNDDLVQWTFNRYGGYFFQIKGSAHMNYSDTPLYSKLKMRTGAGAVDAVRAHALICRYTAAFFGHYLLGRDEPLLQSNSSDPLLNFQIYPRSPGAAASPSGYPEAAASR